MILGFSLDDDDDDNDDTYLMPEDGARSPHEPLFVVIVAQGLRAVSWWPRFGSTKLDTIARQQRQDLAKCQQDHRDSLFVTTDQRRLGWKWGKVESNNHSPQLARVDKAGRKGISNPFQLPIRPRLYRTE